MAYSLTVNGYEFDNPPEDYRKRINLGNNPIPHFRRYLAKYYQSDRQELIFEVEGQLSLNESTDLDDLAKMQQLAVKGGSAVPVDFDPFFSGEAVIVDDPFRQAKERGTYRFTFNINTESTDSTAYPSHATPSTPNTFELGGWDFGYDPNSLEQNYDRQTATVNRLQGISQTTDTAGLVTELQIDGNTDGGGQATLWKKARTNALAYLEAEFQNGWALIDRLEISNNKQAPDYLEGLFEYSMDVLIVSDPRSGIGDVSSYVNYDIENSGTYVSDADSGADGFGPNSLDFTVSDGTGAINDNYVSWDGLTLTLTDNATNYVTVADPNNDGEGKPRDNTSNFPNDELPLYIVETSNGAIVSVRDVRDILVDDNDAEAGDSRTDDTIDLYHTVEAGRSPDDPNNQETTWRRTAYQLAAGATNYFFVEDPNADGDGQVEINQSGYPSNTVPLWRIETDQTTIINRIDDRPSDLKEDGSGDTSTQDLIFEDRFILDDTAFDYARIFRRSDSLPLTDTASWSGSTSFSDSVPLNDSFNGTLFQEIDLLEHNNLSNYYTGDTGVFDTSATDVINNEYSLRLTNATTNRFIYSDSGDGLPYYPVKGDIFSAYIRTGGNTIAAGPVNSSEDGYIVDVDTTFDNFTLHRVDNGSRTGIANTTQSLSGSTIYEAEVEWHDGTGAEPDNTLVATLYEVHQGDLSRQATLATISAQDSTHSGVSAWAWGITSTVSGTETIGDFAAKLGEV